MVPLRQGSAAPDAGDVSDEDFDGVDVDDTEPVPGAGMTMSMDIDGLPPSGEVLGNINPQPDLLVNEANPDPMDADAWPESAEGPDISSPLVNSSGAVDHLNELALMELDADCVVTPKRVRHSVSPRGLPPRLPAMVSLASGG